MAIVEQTLAEIMAAGYADDQMVGVPVGVLRSIEQQLREGAAAAAQLAAAHHIGDIGQRLCR